MLRPVVALLAGLVGAVVVHIAVIFAMPWLAANNSWGRLGRLGDMFAVVRIEPEEGAASSGASAPADGGRHEFAFVDPAFLTATCRFSLADGPVRLASDGWTDFWSASIYTRRGDNLYSINDRSAVNGRFDLLVGSADQLVDTRATSPDPTETTIPVEFGEDEGYLTLRVLVDDETMRPAANAFVDRLRCAVEPQDGSSDPAAQTR